MKLMQILKKKKTLTTSDFSWSMISCRRLYIASVNMSVHDLVWWRPVPSEIVRSPSTAFDVCHSPVVIKHRLCWLIFVGHLICFLSRHDVIAEMIFNHLEKNHYHSVLPANSDEKWIFLSNKSMVYAFVNCRSKWMRRRRHVWWRGELWKHTRILQVQLFSQRVWIQCKKKIGRASCRERV